jgi:serine/threonine-protein kinase
MNEPHDPNRTVAVPSSPAGNEPPDCGHTVDHSSAPADSLDAGLAAGFGPPRSSLGEMRPVLLKEAVGDSAHVVKPSSDAMPTPEQIGDRYQLQGEIARGGMGAVLRGRDVDLGRDLAVKVLLEKHAHRPEVARRFIEEAQIGGQLQHPGVVPVYDIGRFGDRPFFTMKLVKGQTLQALLGERADPSTDRPRFLAIALQVAQTLAYAHAKGVIHRDLKPANVMVGAFGEVQVMDWGLAKVLHEGGTDDGQKASRQHQHDDGILIRTARSSGSTGHFGTDTEAGSLLGTPAYMPPEQANGDVANLDRRADVFGLGAILCEILTGKPPYVGRSNDEVRRKAANSDLADARARLDGCGADPELIVLTSACLSPEAIDRPKDAQAVAEGLTAYLDGVQERLHQAELAEIEAKAKAIEEVKRRRLTLALAATVLLAVTLGGGSWLWVKADRDARIAQTTRDVNDALNQATALREKARTATTGGAALFAQAREQSQRALALVENGPADATLVAQVKRLQAELDEEEKDRILRAALDEARLAQAVTLSENRFAVERAVPKFREAFHAYGLPPGEGKPEVAAEHIRKRPAEIREAIVAALDEWDRLAGDPNLRVQEPHRKWLGAVLEAADLDAWGRQVRAARTMKDPALRRAALEKLAASADTAQVPARALTQLATQLGPAAQVKLLRQAQTRHPADFWVNHYLAQALIQVTLPEWDEAVRFFTAAVALRPDSPGCLMNLGIALHGKGQVDEAIACHQKALALDPKYAAAHSNLGSALYGKGQVEEAIACYNKAIELNPKNANAHNNLGSALKDKGKVEEAIACYRKAVALAPQDAGMHNNLGDALKARGQLDEAIASYRKALEIEPRFVRALNNLGTILCDVKRDYDGAITCFRKAIGLDPKDAKAQHNLGLALYRKGKLDEAIACFRKAIALEPKLATAHLNLGNVLDRQGQLDEAIACYKKAIALEPKLFQAHYNLGSSLRAKGRVEEAIACFRKAIHIEPNDAEMHIALGAMLSNFKRDYDGAVACYRKAIELDPKNTVAHTDLGVALSGKGQVEEAIACFTKAVALNPKHAQAHTNLGIVLEGKGKVEEAIACYKKAIASDPKTFQAHAALGRALLSKGCFVEAQDATARAVELLPADHPWQAPISQHLRLCRRFVKLEARLPAILRGQEQPASAQESLDVAKVCGYQKMPAAAARFSARAFAADAKQADDLKAAHRYNAACYAARAAAGEGKDAGKLDDKERARLRNQALSWLRADLALLRAQLDSGKAADREEAQAKMRHWQQDSDFASVRGEQALAALSQQERLAWASLWRDVAALLELASRK